MTRKYKNSCDVPTAVLCDRVREIVKAITANDSGQSLSRECTMRVPAEADRDADLVLSEVARRLREHAKESAVEADAGKCGIRRYHDVLAADDWPNCPLCDAPLN